MEELLITFETAKLAKEKGFDYKPNYYYNQKGELYFCQTYSNSWHSIGERDYLPATTQSLLQKWLREEKDFVVNAIPSIKEDEIIVWYFHIISFKRANHVVGDGKFYKSYEEALEVGLQKALKQIKE